MIQKNVETSRILAQHAMEHSQDFDDGVSLESIRNVRNYNTLQLKNLEYAHQKVFGDFTSRRPSFKIR